MLPSQYYDLSEEDKIFIVASIKVKIDEEKKELAKMKQQKGGNK